MPKTKTITEKENPTTEAYAEVVKAVKEKANHHRATADAYRSLLQDNSHQDNETAKKMIHKHETMTGVQKDIAKTIKQMNRDFLCDQNSNNRG